MGWPSDRSSSHEATTLYRSAYGLVERVLVTWVRFVNRLIGATAWYVPGHASGSRCDRACAEG